jgi:hypothetical protein
MFVFVCFFHMVARAAQGARRTASTRRRTARGARRAAHGARDAAHGGRIFKSYNIVVVGR